MKPIVVFLALCLIALLGVAGAGALNTLQDRYDPVNYARQSAEIARYEAEAQAHAQAAQAEQFWAPVRAAAANLAVIGVLFALGLTAVMVISYVGAQAVAHARFRFRYVQPDERGLLPVLHGDVHTVAPQALGAFHGARQLEAARQPVPHTITYAPEFDYRADRAGAPLAPAAQPASAAPALPGLTDLADLAFTPSVDRILLGLGPGGAPVTVPMKALWHIGTAGPTGAGKSNIARLIIPQLQRLGAKVCIGDPKWTPYDKESGEDWRLIAARLHLAPARKADEIASLIGYFHDELERRLELRHAGKKVSGPLFLYLDEYTTITEDVKDAAEHVARLGRLGRGVGIFLLVAAHDLLVKSGAGDTRDQIRTGFYLGGDTKTGSVLLDLPQRSVIEREGELTTGLALLRSAATSPAQLVRVPLASNRAVTALLTDNAPTMPRVSATESPRNSHETAHDYSASGRGTAPSAETTRVIALFLAGNDAGAIVTELTGMTSKAGKPYMLKLAEVQAVIRDQLRRGT